jgi:hypothetical protein
MPQWTNGLFGGTPKLHKVGLLVINLDFFLNFELMEVFGGYKYFIISNSIWRKAS